MIIENIIPKYLKELYMKFQDQESRDIFINMLNCYLSDNDFYQLNRRYSYDMDGFEEQSIDRFFYNSLYESQNNPIIIAGGLPNIARLAFNSMQKHGISCECFCDFSNQNTDSLFCGKPVIRIQQLIHQYKNSTVILLETNQNAITTFEQYALTNGWKLNQIKKLRKNIKTYFGLPGILPKTDEIYIDGGSFDGDSIKEFVEWSKGRYKQIYAIEPDINNYIALQNNIKKQNISNIKTIRGGLWNSNCFLNFKQQGISSCFDDSSTTRVKTITIDEFAEDIPVTFIKLDIEGAEYKALQGAETIIKNNKPRLAICVYHKPIDILEIPLYILSLVPEYKLYLRQHDEGYSNNVLYATVE